MLAGPRFWLLDCDRPPADIAYAESNSGQKVTVDQKDSFFWQTLFFPRELWHYTQ